ncbi:MAG TPA: hypothetical protein VNL95_06425 [Dehalococcoidia bacterium]|nr:hypothetical protein [Dehalococcoidia bacterium]
MTGLTMTVKVLQVSQGTSRSGATFWRVDTDIARFYVWDAQLAQALAPGGSYQVVACRRPSGFWHIVSVAGAPGAAGEPPQVVRASLGTRGRRHRCPRCGSPIPPIYTLCPDCLASNGACLDCGLPLLEPGYAYCQECGKDD